LLTASLNYRRTATYATAHLASATVSTTESAQTETTAETTAESTAETTAETTAKKSTTPLAFVAHTIRY
jgi:hypothetical protein